MNTKYRAQYFVLILSRVRVNATIRDTAPGHSFFDNRASLRDGCGGIRNKGFFRSEFSEEEL